MNNITPCPDWAALLSAYHDHQLSAKETRRMEDHLATCAECRAAVAHWDTDRARFTAAYADSTGGVHLRTAVLEELRIMKPSKSQVTISLAKFRWLLGITSFAAAACIILGGFLALRLTFGPPEEQYALTGSLRNIDSTPVATSAPSMTQAEVRQPLEAVGSRPANITDVPAVPASPAVRNRAADTYTAYASKPDALPPAAGATPTWATDAKGYKKVPEGESAHRIAINGPANALSTPDNSGRNFGVVNGIQMHYDMNYQLQVKDALQGARQAQDAVRRHGGFTMDFQYQTAEGQIPTASFRGKIPADEADNVLGEIEKLGQVTAVNIAGEDLTDAFKEKYNALKHQTGTEAELTQRALTELGVKKNLVEFSATFTEPKPREPMSLMRLAEITKGVLKYALLAFITLAVILLALAMLIGPVVLWRRLRRRVRVEEVLPEPKEPEAI